MKEATKQKYTRALETLSMVLEGINRKALLWAVKLIKEKDELRQSEEYRVD